MRFSRSSDEYSAIAPIYDVLLGWILTPLRREIRRVVISKDLRNVLDICSGTGEQCRLLNSAGVRVSGIDLSPAMLSVARAKGPSQIPYLRGNATALPFGNSVFDGVILSLSLHEKTSATRAGIFWEACRVLKRDGTMLIADFTAPGEKASLTGHPLVNAVEWMAGRDHYRNFKSYIEQGGIATLPGISGMQVQQIASYFANSVAIVSISNNKIE
jgi:demethylmenaquinone methyltransferase/2-methoxy-6-polyprenyl-1,4-benzoquinol methylase